VSAVTVHIEGYSTGDGRNPGIEVDQWEGLVHLNTRQIDDPGTPSMSPGEARALAAALLHAASEVDR
jgi:hypothetical protein